MMSKSVKNDFSNASNSSSSDKGDCRDCSQIGDPNGSDFSSNNVPDVDLTIVDTRSKKSPNNSSVNNSNSETSSSKKKVHNWALKFSCGKFKSKSSAKTSNSDNCVCIGYKKNEEPSSSYLFSSNLDLKQINELRKIISPSSVHQNISSEIYDKLVENSQNATSEESSSSQRLCNQPSLLPRSAVALQMQMPVVFLTISPLMDISR